jgi:hypothetical protein
MKPTARHGDLFFNARMLKALEEDNRKLKEAGDDARCGYVKAT